MKTINAKVIQKEVAKLCIEANTKLRKDVLAALRESVKQEKAGLSREMLNMVIENAAVAREKNVAICQDTGMPVIFVELGQKVKINGDLVSAINRGVTEGYRKGFLRNSIVSDPILRNEKSTFSPVVIHTELNNSSKVKITAFPKGFGSENKSQVKMLNPTAGSDEIRDYVIESVKKAGPDACPPFFIGVGIGGTQDKACLLAKKALLRPINKSNKKLHLRKLEKELLAEMNKSKIGVMGLGGAVTALGVNIETYPTHIAGLPVAVNICCHALRSASKTF